MYAADAMWWLWSPIARSTILVEGVRPNLGVNETVLYTCYLRKIAYHFILAPCCKGKHHLACSD